MALSAIIATSAVAESDLGLKDLGVAVGFVSPDGFDGTFSIGAFVDHGTITPNIGLESRIDYWGQSESAFGAEASVRDIAIGARGKYYFEIDNPKIRPFAGTGLGVHFIKAEVTVQPPFGFPTIPAITTEASSTELGLDLGGGLAAAVGDRADLFTELWYSVVSDVDQFALRVGLGYQLGPYE
jgi:hypothetical protein